MPLFPPAASVTILVDGQPLPAYVRAYLAHGRVFAPLEPVLGRLADRAWFDGATLVIERDDRRVRVIVPLPDAMDGTYVSVGQLARGLGVTVSYEPAIHQLNLWTQPPAVALPTPFNPSLPQAVPQPVFTPEPIPTPKPQWSGPPLPRRTPLPLPPPR
ncbi:MAG: hypothetical protein JO029_13410 [Candidatus Eremiobacteraeota bacterium]|nr:hypothetical protein [Candidatus Eremiobacteraeota bacterium]MBV8583064.1 hypothetical protein [Candidatus Eremiobacteraeota bacterium]MBV8654629.1 hypothetical protein [Candidatus Eremiobacteraeota bacterium]